MKIHTLLLGAALAAVIPVTAAQNHFIVFDNFLRVPAYCYPLPAGWTGMGLIKWEIPAKSNPYVETVVLANPGEHRIVQQSSFFNKGTFILEQSGNIYSDANAMTAYLAQQINSSIVVPGLANFRPKYGRFSDDIPLKTRQAINMGFNINRTAQFKKMFKVECFFDCEYNGARCEALWEFVCAFTAVQVRPRLPTMATVMEYDRFFTIAPPGELAAAKKAGGRLLAGVFVNRLWKFSATQIRPNLPTIASVVEHNLFFTIAPPGELAATKKIGGRLLAGRFVNKIWKFAQDRMIAAMIKGKTIGMNEGMDLMRQSQAENERIMADVRRRWSEVIREVKTVDNPLSPGDKIERPLYFDHSLINSQQDTLIMSDRNIEPHEAERLIGQGFWTVVD